MSPLSLLVLLPFLLLLPAVSAIPALPFRNVTLPHGVVTGTERTAAGRRVWQFLSLPFAEPPVGSLRFAKPRPLRRKWASPLMADQSPPRCMQLTPPAPRPGFKFGNLSEDCLYLNVWTPHNVTGRAAAVMVWIHGGAFIEGQTFPSTDGRALAALGDVVVVSVAYRLGPFGFWSPEPGRQGNWGLWDQQLGLQWVKDNIAAFGGDPTRVTIFGESAGSVAVSAHLLNADSRRLFHRAIEQSGSILASWASTTAATAMAAEYRRFARVLGCRTAGSAAKIFSCMRGVSTSALNLAGGGLESAPWMPVVDGDFLKQAPEAAIKATTRPTELMVGLLPDEGGMLLYTTIQNLAFLKTPATVSSLVSMAFPYYPMTPVPIQNATKKAIETRMQSWAHPKDFVANFKAQSLAFSQSMMICPINREARAYAQLGSSKVFAFVFAHRPTNSKYPAYIGATHTDDLPFVFGMAYLFSSFMNFTEAERNFTDMVIAEWSSFARNGRPASADWRAYTAAHGDYRELHVDAPSTKKVFYRRDECPFWDQILPTINDMSLSLAADHSCPPLSKTGEAVIGVLSAALFLSVLGLVGMCVLHHRAANTGKGTLN